MIFIRVLNVKAVVVQEAFPDFFLLDVVIFPQKLVSDIWGEDQVFQHGLYCIYKIGCFYVKL